MPIVSVLVLNWNGQRFLPDCLGSLESQTHADYEIILVDNGSTDGSPEWVARHFPQVRLIRNSTNLGFATANNIGVQSSSAEFVAMLNNDTWVDPDWLSQLVGSLDSPDVGMAASQIVFRDHPGVLDSAGIEVDRVGIGWNRGWGQARATAMASQEVFGPCAGAAIYRRAMLDEIGLFDEDYFIYYEDVDLAWRAQWAGWRCVYVPGAIVHHVHSATTIQGSPFKSRLLGRNKIWTLCRNYPFPQLLWYAPFILAYDLMSVAYAMATGGGLSGVRGRLEALGKVPLKLASRRHVVRKISSRAMMARLRSVESPWQVVDRHRRLCVAEPDEEGELKVTT